ncbi:MAG: nitroreductase family protein [Myxococcota bacterium]
MPDLSLHEAMYTLRAMRRLKPDPVSEEDLRYLVDAATMAPTATNAQTWAFVVITDSLQRRAIGEIYREIGRRLIRDEALAGGQLSDKAAKVYHNAMILVEGMVDVPAQILIAARGKHPTDPIQAAAYYGSIYPAVQNLMLAARSRGLGATLTTLHKARERDVKAVLSIPDDYETIALIPVGVPVGRWGRPLRRPSREVTHWDRWGGSGPVGR